MWLHILILTLVTLQRVIELVIAHRNTKKIEALDAGHRPLLGG